ncbi:MAG: hypothetical protein KBD73_02945 [Candidatus Magasanikbacteria bacterium]|nr:hypothetical protein [Candidatus Magasanikbacteria bacterium]
MKPFVSNRALKATKDFHEIVRQLTSFGIKAPGSLMSEAQEIIDRITEEDARSIYKTQAQDVLADVAARHGDLVTRVLNLTGRKLYDLFDTRFHPDPGVYMFQAINERANFWPTAVFLEHGLVIKADLATLSLADFNEIANDERVKRNDLKRDHSAEKMALNAVARSGLLVGSLPKDWRAK